MNAKLNKYFCAPSTYHQLPIPQSIQNMVVTGTPTVSYIFRNKAMLVSFLKDGEGGLAFNL